MNVFEYVRVHECIYIYDSGTRRTRSDTAQHGQVWGDLCYDISI